MERYIIEIFNKLSGSMGPGLAIGILLCVGLCAAMGFAAKLIIVQWVADMAAKRSEREQQSKMLFSLLTNHVQHLAAAQEGFGTFQREMVDSIRTSTESLKVIHKDLRDFREESDGSHIAMAKDLSRIDGRLD